MSGLAEAIARFADGELVLVGDQRDETIFVATAADRIDAERLRRLHQLGRGMVVLGLAAGIARRLELPEPWTDARRRLGMSLTAPIDAAAGIGGGWSLHDRALTMRVAANPDTQPRDLAIPGHVYPARIDERPGGAATAAIELARLSDRAPAVALCAVIDRDGIEASLPDAQGDRELARLPAASTAELYSCSISRHAAQLAVGCQLPTRDGLFRAVGHGAAEGDPATIALIHGNPALLAHPLVHVHVACLFGDAFGSLLCNCRRELDAAVGAMLDDGAGVIIYAKSSRAEPAVCTRNERINSALAAGLLRTVGVRDLRLSTCSAWLADELRTCGLEVGDATLRPRRRSCSTPRSRS
jgi:3,4-dihydroxy 2-butanone 4-phosphate synthase/GTP cyclohydrolase II